jgi:hypothetical protein
MRRSLILCLVLAGLLGSAPLADASSPSYVYSRQYLKDRFGDTLCGDVYLPAAGGKQVPGRFPVIFEYVFQSPYQTDIEEPAGQQSLSGPPLAYVEHGYAYVNVNQPGTGCSSGPLGIYDRRVGLAGVDAVQWLGTRSWSNGNVGMWGTSGQGIAQALVAEYRPSHLKTIVPAVTSTNFYTDVLCRGGMATSWERLVLEAAILGDYNAENGLTVPSTPAEISAFAGLWTQKLLNGWLPPTPELFPTPDPAHPLSTAQSWADVLHGCGKQIQAFSRVFDVGRIDVPIWSFGSWDDYFLLGNLNLYTAATDSPYRRLTLDDNGHNDPAHGYDFIAGTLRWYDRWLKGIHNGIDSGPRVDYYTIEQNSWHHANDWPLPNAATTRMYLDAGPASPVSTGSLTPRAPTVRHASDTYVYNPLAGANDGTFGVLTTHADSSGQYAVASGSQVIPGLGSDNILVRNQPNGPGDQRASAPESLVYLSPPLTHDLEVTGPVRATLYASTTATDTDWVVKLIDVFPTTAGNPLAGPQPGYWSLATTGWLSGTRRDSLTDPQPIGPNQVIPYRVSLLPTSYQFKAGHRIGVMIASADLSRTYPNPHPAVNTILIDAGQPSSIELPIVAGDLG